MPRLLRIFVAAGLLLVATTTVAQTQPTLFSGHGGDRAIADAQPATASGGNSAASFDLDAVRGRGLDGAPPAFVETLLQQAAGLSALADRGPTSVSNHLVAPTPPDAPIVTAPLAGEVFRTGDITFGGDAFRDATGAMNISVNTGFGNFIQQSNAIAITGTPATPR